MWPLLTFPHELAFLKIHDLRRNQFAIHHDVFFHDSKAAVLQYAVNLIWLNWVVQEGAQLCHTVFQVLGGEGEEEGGGEEEEK